MLMRDAFLAPPLRLWMDDGWFDVRRLTAWSGYFPPSAVLCPARLLELCVGLRVGGVPW